MLPLLTRNKILHPAQAHRQAAASANQVAGAIADIPSSAYVRYDIKITSLRRPSARHPHLVAYLLKPLSCSRASGSSMQSAMRGITFWPDHG